MISGIYSARFFSIQDHTGSSTKRIQGAGIAQGCPLSPYLFIAVQTVMMHDVFSGLELHDEPGFVVTRDILYADDTLLASRHAYNLQLILNRIVDEGAKYGLEFNWDKTIQMQISTPSKVSRPDGTDISSVREAVYLGGIIACDGRAAREISRRLGECGRLFDQLKRMWSHARITTRRKLEIYRACVVTKLLYSLDSLWLLKAERQRIDGFHCKCLRRLLSIPSSFISRVSNETVLERAKEKPLSLSLLHRQAAQYRKIAASTVDNLAKQLVCNNEGRPKMWSVRRRRGRPRQHWSAEVFKWMESL